MQTRGMNLSVATVIQIAKMQASVATNLHYLSILFYNKSQKWKILATLGLF